MERANSTTLVVVGGEASLLEDLDRLPNVRAASLAGRPEAAVKSFVEGANTAYVAHDRDPLEHVASAWVEFYDDRGTLGTLDVEVEATSALLRRGDASLPDYYVVLDPEALPPTWKHWWLGVLPGVAPMRVLPAESDADAVRRVLRRLPSGRTWPESLDWLHRLTRNAPDRLDLGG
ncbi:hypothetical protein [Naasia aerilata]|uniref:Uncharacterized protein n=1 Tax=Naasia aerilata TaxID=1162966 RepID=A0ABM8G9B4_9MICO|nr:hypothetical protein [Naasia aerilata]BDZ44768.1 hypothetical protein GCM10025866_06770 [Naasia aerilata]